MLSPEELLHFYGGSDAAAVAGVHPFKKPIDVYARLKEGRVDDEVSDPLYIGDGLEPFVRQFSVRKYGWESCGPVKLMGVIRPFIRANLDDILKVNGELMLGEYKTANKYSEHKYGEEGSDEFPVEHHCQTQLYFEACKHKRDLADIERGFLVAFIGGIELRRYPIRRDPEMGAALVEIIERFHVDHVLKGVPPPLDVSDSTARWLQERYPKNNGTMLQATPELDALAEQLRVAREAKEKAEALEEAAKIELKKIIADADGIQGEWWKVLYRASKGSVRTDWEALAKALNPPEDLVNKYTRITNGSRRFIPTFKEQK